jgi:hypothetical protein
VLEPTEAKSGKKRNLARRSRKRKESGDFTREIAPRRTPKRSSQKRQSQPIRNSIHFSGGKDFLFSFTICAAEPPLG